MPAATPALERFARETLGCGCAPEVFLDVTEDRATLPGLGAPVRRIGVGGRLLIYLIPAPDSAAAAAHLDAWAATARAERERLGMNRARLVLGLADASTAVTAPLADAFASSPARDERLHLHLLPAAALAIGPAVGGAAPDPGPPAAPPATPPPTRRRLRDWAVDLALILAIFLGVQWWQARPFASGEAPPLAGPGPDGAPIDLAALRGRPVLVHFWATWCPICKLTIGGVDAIARDHPVLTVAMQSGDAAEVRAYMAAAGLSFPVVIDADGRIAARWGVRGVPANFVLDAAGRIDFATPGATTETGLRARLWAAGLAGSAPASPP